MDYAGELPGMQPATTITTNKAMTPLGTAVKTELERGVSYRLGDGFWLSVLSTQIFHTFAALSRT